MGRAQKGRWKEQYFKENFCQTVYSGLLLQLENEAAHLQRLTATLEDEETKKRFQYVADRLTLLTAQASGRESVFDLSKVAMPEDAESKLPDPRERPKT
jgi:hypothetical protein